MTQQEFEQMPMGLSFAMAQNKQAMDRYQAMSDKQKRQVIEHTHQISSKREMKQFVEQIANGSY